MKLKALTLVIAIAIPSVSVAQDPQGGPPGGGRAPMLQNSIEWLLTQKAHYRPNGEQVAKLEEAAKALNDSIAGPRDEIRKLREQLRDPNDGDDQRRTRFEKMRPLMDQIRKQDELATKEALKILNSEQQKVVEELLEARRKEMQARRRGFGGAP